VGKSTEIAYCDSTCNPLIGCDGCELWSPAMPPGAGHCYAQRLVSRYCGRNGWPAEFGRPAADWLSRIDRAIAWPDLRGTARPGKAWLNGWPRIVFLCDLADPFTESVAPDWLAAYLPLLAASPHIWLLLTKRPRRLREFVARWGELPRNVWPGVTVTSQETRWRAEELLDCPAACRWLSLEPLLGPVDLAFAGCDWVVAGGESGPGARPMNARWIREVRDGCDSVGVPFFFKQWGGTRAVKTVPLLDDMVWRQMPRTASPAGPCRLRTFP
jgi:protein gp37